MADAIIPRRYQYVGHWPDWSSSAPPAHGTARPVRPVSDKYALATAEQTQRQTNRRKSSLLIAIERGSPIIPVLSALNIFTKFLQGYWVTSAGVPNTGAV